MSERQQDEIDHYRGKVIPEMQAEIDRLRNRNEDMEAALRGARHFVYRCLMEEYAKGAGCDTLESLVTRMDSLLDASPPDSEPAMPTHRCAGCGEYLHERQVHDNEWHEAAVEINGELEPQPCGPVHRLDDTPPQRRDAGDALREKLANPEAMQRVTERAAQRQDAMLERPSPLEIVDHIEEWAECHTKDAGQIALVHAWTGRLRQALSRISDASEATVDEIVSEYEWRGEDEEGREGGYDPTGAERCMLKDFAMFLLSEVGTRTSDEGGVPEAMHRLPENWRKEANMDPRTYGRAINRTDQRWYDSRKYHLEACANQLDRAIAQSEQGKK